jgi:hypothetical protein
MSTLRDKATLLIIDHFPRLAEFAHFLSGNRARTLSRFATIAVTSAMPTPSPWSTSVSPHFEALCLPFLTIIALSLNDRFGYFSIKCAPPPNP